MTTLENFSTPQISPITPHTNTFIPKFTKKRQIKNTVSMPLNLVYIFIFLAQNNKTVHFYIICAHIYIYISIYWRHFTMAFMQQQNQHTCFSVGSTLNCQGEVLEVQGPIRWLLRGVILHLRVATNKHTHIQTHLLFFKNIKMPKCFKTFTFLDFTKFEKTLQHFWPLSLTKKHALQNRHMN